MRLLQQYVAVAVGMEDLAVDTGSSIAGEIDDQWRDIVRIAVSAASELSLGHLPVCS